MKAITRREWISSAAATALTGCRKREPVKPSPVLIARAAYSQELYDVVRRMLA